MQVDGRAALITGGGTGVGRATALDLARRGCAVAVNYSRSKDDAEATAAEARALGVRAVALQADVADDQYAVAAGHYAQQRWTLAAEEFRTFLQRYPHHARAGPSVFYLAEALLFRRHRTEA